MDDPAGSQLPSAEVLADLRARAVALARRGGDVLLQQLASRPAASSKGVRRELVTEADRATERVVVGGILEQFPDHSVLAEEGVLTAQGQRSSASDWNWIIDPLDGTTNFVHGLPFFAVAIGLTWRSVPVVGVVHAPVLGETFSAAHGLGATCNGAPIRVSRTSEMADALLATGFAYTRDQAGAVDNLERLRRIMPHVRDIRRCGSAELDLCYVARGSFDAYWEYGLAPYDVAAGAVIVREAGGVVTDIEGGDAWLFGGQVVASNGALHEAVRRHLP